MDNRTKENTMLKLSSPCVTYYNEIKGDEK